MQGTIPIQLDIQPTSLELLCDDLKRLSDGISKASQQKVFDDNESQQLCDSLNNLGEVILALAKSVEKTIQKAKDLGLINVRN